MKRGSPLRRKTPLRSASPAKRKPVKRARQKAANDARFRSERYLRFVRSLPCCVCGAPADSAHHLVGMWQVSGMGLKAPDSLVMPVCDGPGGCHARIHAEKALRDRQPDFLRHTIALGMQEFDGEIREALSEALAFINRQEAA